jgi:flagellar FliL protein
MGAAATTIGQAGTGGLGETEPAAKPGGRSKLLLLGAPVALAAVGAGLWFGGILPPLLGIGAAPAKDAHDAAKPAAPVYLEMPEIVANLNAGPRRASYIKLHSRLELGRAEDADMVKAAMPRLLDMFQTYLRDMSPEELRGSASTYRLREELIARANAAVAPARVVDVLFTEMLVQ